MGGVLAMAGRNKATQKPSVVPVKLHVPTVEKLKVIAAYLQTEEGAREHRQGDVGEVSLAEAHDIAVSDALNGFYLKALKRMHDSAAAGQKK